MYIYTYAYVYRFLKVPSQISPDTQLHFWDQEALLYYSVSLNKIRGHYSKHVIFILPVLLCVSLKGF